MRALLGQVRIFVRHMVYFLVILNCKFNLATLIVLIVCYDQAIEA